MAIKVMAEGGIDMSGQVSKDVASLQHPEFDYVITLCDNAHDACPFFPEPKPGSCTLASMTLQSWPQGHEPKMKRWPATGVCGMKSKNLWNHSRIL